MALRARSTVLLAVVSPLAALLSACSLLGGGDERADTSTRPAAPEELARVAVPAGGELPDWSYAGDGGPDRWGELAEDWSTCATGTAQSPLDLTGGDPFEAAPASTTTSTLADAPPGATGRRAGTAAASGSTTTTWLGAVAEQEIDFRYHASSFEVTDGGAVAVVPADAGAVIIDGVAFPLVEVRVHTPSEHTLGGAHYPMELQLVHRSDAGELAVVALIVQVGAANEQLAAVLDALGRDEGSAAHAAPTFDPAALVPANRTMVRYDGSLTVPPCSEQVRWHVMLTPLQLSAEQIRAFTSRHGANNRPVQPSNGRTIVIEVDDLTDVAGATTTTAVAGH